MTVADPPDARVLQAPRRQQALAVLVGTLFVASGVGLVTKGHARGWIGIVFFGYTAVVCAARVVRPARLVLTPDGMRVKSWRRSDFYAWSSCARFRPWSSRPFGLTKVVVFEYTGTDATRYPGLTRYPALAGANSLVPAMGGLSTGELSTLLNDYVRMYASARD